MIFSKRVVKIIRLMPAFFWASIRNLFGFYTFRYFPRADALETNLRDHYVSVGQDPQIVLVPTGRKYPAGLVEIQLRIETSVRSWNHAEIYYSSSKEFSASKTIKIPFLNNEPTRVRVNLQRPIKALRIDPCECVGNIEIKQFEIRKLSLLKIVLEQFKKLQINSPRAFFAVVQKGYKLFATQGIKGLEIKLAGRFEADYSSWIKNYDQLDPEKVKNSIASFRYKPLISVVMPTYNIAEKWLRAAIQSVQNQLYGNWELCISDDCSPNENVRDVISEYVDADKRIKKIFRLNNGHISENTNSALSLATGEFVALLDHDDELSPYALYRVVESLNNNPNVDVLFSDEDKIDEEGNRFDPYFKPDWMPDLFNSQNCVSHLGVYRKAVIDTVGGFRRGYEGAQDWDLMMRISEIIPSNRIRHLPYVLYHWRTIPGSTAKAKNEKNYIEEAQRRTIQDHFDRTRTPVILLPHLTDFWRVKYKWNVRNTSVSIIIPTRDQKSHLKNCIDSILSKTTYPNYEIIVVDNQSKERDTLDYLDSLSKLERIKIFNFDSEFNYSAINNFAVERSNADVVVLLNSDTKVISEDWLEEMVSLAVRQTTGAVGAKLYFPDDTIQHAGVVLGIGGIGSHAYLHQTRLSLGQMGRACLTQNYSAVTGACLAVERKKYLEIGGLNETELKVAYNDIDFCLRLLRAGYRNVWTPFAELYHFESASRGYENEQANKSRFEKEYTYMMETWGNLIRYDPAYNPNLTLEREDFSLAFPPRTAS